MSRYYCFRCGLEKVRTSEDDGELTCPGCEDEDHHDDCCCPRCVGDIGADDDYDDDDYDDYDDDDDD